MYILAVSTCWRLYQRIYWQIAVFRISSEILKIWKFQMQVPVIWESISISVLVTLLDLVTLRHRSALQCSQIKFLNIHECLVEMFTKSS